MNHNSPGRTVTAWRFVAASVQGGSHRRTGLPCQDAYHTMQLADGSALIAVADGAGSAARAGEASALAVRAAIMSLTQHLAVHNPAHAREWDSLIATAFVESRAALTLEAAATRSPLREWATTLLLLVLSHEWTVCGLVGDCAAVVRTVGGELLSLCPPQKGEYANMTNFLSQPDALASLDVAVLPEPVTSAAAFSDGLLELALNVAHNRPFVPFFDPLFAFAASIDMASVEDADAENKVTAHAQLAGFLDSPRVNARTDDDKTLVLTYRHRVKDAVVPDATVSSRTTSGTTLPKTTPSETIAPETANSEITNADTTAPEPPERPDDAR